MIAPPLIPSAAGLWVEQWLSKERFAVYLHQCGGNRAEALDLYLHNSQLAAAFLQDLGHLEVALRNAYDRRLQQAQPPGRHWLFDDQGPVLRPVIVRGRDINHRSRGQVTEAIRRAGGAQAPAGKILTELPFGFWSHLTDTAREKLLWIPHLRFAFPKSTGRPLVAALIRDLNLIRNRAAHQEKLLTFDLPGKHRELLQLLSMLCPELGRLIANTSGLPDLLESDSY